MKKYKPDHFLALGAALFEIGFWAICFFLPMMCTAAPDAFIPSFLLVSAPFLVLLGVFFVINTVLNLIFGIFQKPHVYIDGEKIILGKSVIDGRSIDTIKMDFGTWVCKGSLEAYLMGTAIDGGHIVCKGNDKVIIAVVILKSHLSCDIALLSFHIYNVGMKLFALVLADIFNKGFDTALVHKIVVKRIALTIRMTGTKVCKSYTDTCVKEGLLTESLLESSVIEVYVLKYGSIRLKAHVKTLLVARIAYAFELTNSLTLLKAHLIALSVVAVVYLHPLGKSVNN